MNLKFSSFITFGLLILSISAYSQNVGINNPTPDNSAILDVVSTNKGFLAPRMTSAQRLAIPIPATGLLVFDTTAGSFFFFNGTIWVSITGGGSGWGLTGNAGTSSTTNFIGTTDAQNLTFRVNNLPKMKLFQDGRLELIGTGSDSSNISIGLRTGSFATAPSGVYIGKEAGSSNAGAGNIMIGTRAGRINSFGAGNSFIGFESGLNNTNGSQNTFLGTSTGNLNGGGSGNTFIGNESGQNNSSGNSNTFIGKHAGHTNSTSNLNTYVGFESGLNSNGDENTYVGANTGKISFSSNNSIFGSSAGAGSGFSTGFNSIFGAHAGQFLSTGGFNSFFGESAGIAASSSSFNSLYGYHSGFGLSGGDGGNSFFGSESGVATTYGSSNTFIGQQSGSFNTSGSENTTLGFNANLVPGDLINATAIGANAAVGASNSIVLGSISGLNGATQNTNVGIGTISPTARLHIVGNLRQVDGLQGAGKVMVSDALGNGTWTNPSAIGIVETDPEVLSTSSGSVPRWNGFALIDGSIFDNGTNIGLGTTTPSDRLHIVGNIRMVDGNQATGRVMVSDANGTATWTNASSIAITETDPQVSSVTTGRVPRWNGATLADGALFDNATNVGVGTVTPLDRLHVVGNIRMVDGNQAAGKVLTSDVNGTATWQTLNSTLTNAWGLSGNTATNAATNFIGTTDSIDLVLRTNTIDKFRLKADGRVEIGNKGTNHTYDGALGIAPKLYVASDNSNNNVVFQASSLSGDPVSLYFGMSRGTTLSPAITQANENLGNIFFSGYDGTKFVSAAAINVNLDGSPGSNDMPGKIDFRTTPDGSFSPVVRMTIRNNGNVGIGTLLPTQKLHVSDTVRIEDGNQGLNKVLTSDALGNGTWQTLDPSKTNAWGLTGNAGTNPATNFIGTTDLQNLLFRTNNLERLRVSSTGTVGIGVAAAGTNFVNPLSSLEIFGNGSTTGDVTMHTAGTNAFGNFIVNLKSRGTQIAPTLVANGDRIATYSAYAYDGTKFGSMVATQHAAFMSMEMDATPGLNDLPTRITFGTTPDGSLSAVERMRITNSGNVGIGTAAPTQKLHVNDTIRIVDGNQGLNKVLTSDALGNGTWQTLNPAQTNAWGLTGNSGTSAATNFIGTTDDQDLIVKRNNIRAGFLGTSNTSWGVDALNSITTGIRNTAIGDSALLGNTVGIENTANGFKALQSNINGVQNTAFGVMTLNANISGQINTAIGAYVLMANASGFGNTASGSGSMVSNTSGSHNTALGQGALRISTTGNSNTALGQAALITNTTGNNNTALGQGADVSAGNFINATAIGSKAQVDTSNAMVLGSVNGINGATASVNVGIGTNKPLSRLDVDGSIGADIAITVTNITLNETNHTVIITGGGTPVITLPAAATCPRRIYVLVNQTASVRTVSTYISFTGVGSTAIPANSSITLQSTGNNWFRIQ